MIYGAPYSPLPDAGDGIAVTKGMLGGAGLTFYVRPGVRVDVNEDCGGLIESVEVDLSLTDARWLAARLTNEVERREREAREARTKAEVAEWHNRITNALDKAGEGS